jgi:hypothetical protein
VQRSQAEILRSIADSISRRIAEDAVRRNRIQHEQYAHGLAALREVRKYTRQQVAPDRAEGAG